MRTQTIKNTFPPSEVHISTWSGNDIINSGDTAVYVRASIIANWVSEEDANTILSVAPVAGTDYTITVDSGWFKASDGFYYHKQMLSAAQSVVLVTEAVQKTQKDGYKLHVQIISSAIQTTPIRAVEESWRAIQVNADGTLQSAN